MEPAYPHAPGLDSDWRVWKAGKVDEGAVERELGGPEVHKREREGEGVRASG